MMQLTLIPAYDRQADVAALFTEYTKMLVETDPLVADCLAVQGYEAEFADLEKKYGLPFGRLYIALWDGAVAGCVALRQLDEQRCELKRLFVRPQLRGHRIGEALVRQVMEDARAIGYRHMLLDTLPFMRSAIRIYREAGFYNIPAYYHNPISDAIYMQCDL